MKNIPIQPMWFKCGVILLGVLCSSGAFSSGLSDLTRALDKVVPSTHLTGQYSVNLWRKELSDDGREVEAAIEVELSMDEQGLTVHYPTDLLAEIQREEVVRSQNPNALTPTLEALGQLGIADIRQNLASVDRFLQLRESATFVNEVVEPYKDKPARKLNFVMGEDVLSDEDKKYVKDFDVRLSVWIDEHGVPLASEVVSDIKGRAFVVVKFSSRSTDLVEYALLDGTLVSVYKQYQSHSKGPRGEREERVTKRFAPQPKPAAP